MAQQVRLDRDVETYVVDEQSRIREQEHTEVSAAQAVNRMLREWRNTRDATLVRHAKARR